MKIYPKIKVSIIYAEAESIKLSIIATSTLENCMKKRVTRNLIQYLLKLYKTQQLMKKHQHMFIQIYFINIGTGNIQLGQCTSAIHI